MSPTICRMCWISSPAMTISRNEQDYEAFAKLVDPESVRDYFAANVWLNNKWGLAGKELDDLEDHEGGSGQSVC